jgi:hypothetical protein
MHDMFTFSGELPCLGKELPNMDMGSVNGMHRVGPASGYWHSVPYRVGKSGRLMKGKLLTTSMK